jgi:hypothetical protein
MMTQLLCAVDQTIPHLLSQDEMKIKLYNPGSLSQKCIDKWFDSIVKRCIHYSSGNKLKILAAVDHMMAEENLKQNQACVIMQVCDSKVLRWCSNRVLLEAAARPEEQILHQGPAGCVDAFTEELVSFVDKWRGKGILVSCLCLIRKACELSPAFSNKTLSLQKAAISHFMAKTGLVNRMATHTAQRTPREMCNEARGYLDVIVTIVNDGNRLPAFTIDMDQTPVLHAMNLKDTIDRRGRRTINLRTAGGDSRRVTVAITIRASGH